MAGSPRKGYRICAKCHRGRAERFFKSTRATTCSDCLKKRVKNANKDARLRETYNISLEDWFDILDAQGGVCAICKKKHPTYDTDHDHARERALIAAGMDPLEAARMSVRGLIGRAENRRGLPTGRDDPAWFRAAAEYLENPPAWEVLH